MGGRTDKDQAIGHLGQSGPLGGVSDLRRGAVVGVASLLVGGATVGCGHSDSLSTSQSSQALSERVDVPEQSYQDHVPRFPFAGIQPLPPQVVNAFRSDPELTQWPWVCDADFRHDTGPTSGEFCYRGEWDLTNGVLFGWDARFFGCEMPDQIELIRASLESTAEVSVLTAAETVPSAKRCLQDRGFSQEQIDAINFIPVEVDTIWIRDYGPEFLSRCDGSPGRAMVDANYFGVLPRPDNCRPLERGPLSFGRTDDDASPTELATLLEAGRVSLRSVAEPSVHRLPLVFEGGNIFTDGQGTCFRNRIDAATFNSAAFFPPWLAGGWSYTQDDINELISEYYNCSRVVVLDSMRPTSFTDAPFGVIDHIDMTVTFLSADTVLVGDYNYETPSGIYLTRSGDAQPDDAFNDPILDGNAEKLLALGYNVVRLPMPAPYCVREVAANCRADRDLTSNTIIECPAATFDAQGLFVGGVDPETNEPIYRTWATFANSIRIGNRLMMPSFRASSLALGREHRDLLQAQEAEAFRVYQQQLDRLEGAGAVSVVRIPSDGLAPCVGSLQCITKTY